MSENIVQEQGVKRSELARQVQTAGSGEVVRRLAYEPTGFGDLERASTMLASSSLVPDALRGKPQDVMLVLWTAREYGFGAMQGLQSLHVIKGKVVFSATMIQGLVESSGKCEYLMLVESTAERATYETLRKGQPRPVTMSYTLEQAKRAGLAGKDNWKNHGEAMLRARALTTICRAVYGDVMSGVYTPDELEIPEPKERVVTPVDPAAVEKATKVIERINSVNKVTAAEMEALRPVGTTLGDREKFQWVKPSANPLDDIVPPGDDDVPPAREPGEEG